MAEIIRDPIEFEANGVAYALIDENHTLNDIARWIMKNKVDGDELHRILGEMLDA